MTTRKPVGPPAVLIGPIRAVAFTPDGKTCLCVAADGTVRRWPVPAPFAEPDLDRLADRVALMTGQRMDDNQGLDYVPADEWRALRAKLVGDGSTALVPPRPDADWHDAVAADAEQDGDAFGAEWHLDRLAALRPTDWTIPARRGRVLAAAGRRDEAAAAYAAAAPPGAVAAGAVRLAAGRRRDRRGGRPQGGGAVEPGPGRRADPGRLDPVRAAGRPGRPGPGGRRRGRGDPPRGRAEPSSCAAAIGAADSGDWKRAAVLLTSLAATRPSRSQDRHLQAVACLKAGDAAGYRAACAGIAKRLPPVGPKLSLARGEQRGDGLRPRPERHRRLDQAARLDRPRPGPAGSVEKENPARRTVLRRSGTTYLNTRGAVLYRAGRFEEAAKVLREGMSLHPDGGAFHDWLFLALAEHRLGHADAAKEAAAKARAAKAGAKPDTVWARAEVELLAAELDAALPPPGK